MQPRPFAFAMIFAGLASAGAGVFLVLGAPDDTPDAPAAQAAASNEIPARAANTATAPGAAVPASGDDTSGGAAARPLPLAGTRVDGRLSTDADGNLVIDRDLRRVFDYFLVATAAEPYAQSAARLQAYLAERLPEPAAGQAAAVLEQYLQYKARLFEMESRALQDPGSVSGDPEHLARHLETLARVRREVLTPEVVTAFFAEEEAYDRYILQRYRILADTRLTDAQKAEQLVILKAALPAELQDSLARTHGSQTLSERTRVLRQNGADAAEIRRLRLAAVGAEGTERLESLDRQREAWETRLARYHAEKAQLLAADGLAETDRAAALDALLARHFSAREQLRVRALERTSGQ